MTKNKATIEILYEVETTLGSTPNGVYMVSYYDADFNELGESFHKTIEEAEVNVRDYQREEENEEEE
jgi:hypothetical protein